MLEGLVGDESVGGRIILNHIFDYEAMNWSDLAHEKIQWLAFGYITAENFFITQVTNNCLRRSCTMKLVIQKTSS